MIRFTVPGRAAPKGSMRVVRGNVLIQSCAREKPWSRTVAVYATEAMRSHQILLGPVHLRILFEFARPKGHKTRLGALRSGVPALPLGRTAGDLDKLVRSVGDALTGICYEDDSQVTQLTAAKIYGAEDLVLIQVDLIKEE